MTIPDGGQIAASDINAEFGRGGQMDIWAARNGYYGGINGCSGKRPGAPGRSDNSGYAWNDWWGYTHNFSCCNIYQYLVENACDADVRTQRYWFFGGIIQEFWNWGTSYYYAFSAAKYDQLQTWFDPYIDWGNYWCWCYKRVYSNYRGYFADCSYYQNSACNLVYTCDYSGEYFEVQNLCY